MIMQTDRARRQEVTVEQGQAPPRPPTGRERRRIPVLVEVPQLLAAAIVVTLVVKALLAQAF
jgi:hypothetical protein